MTDLRETFLHFAGVCAGESPLYVELSRRVAEATEILGLAAGGIHAQPPPNLLFGAVHFLLFAGVRHELAEFYPSLAGRRDAADVWPAFADFCRQHERDILQLVATRRVQTNEVGRCGVLLPAFSAAGRLFQRPLHLIEVGASAGLALLFDQYRYEYSDGRIIGPHSLAVIRTALRGPLSPADLALPPVVARVGVDLAPVDVTDADAMRWLQALIWPEHCDRLALQRQAVGIARIRPPRVVAGDALQSVPALIADVGDDAVPCVYHSHATYQMSDEWRAALRAVIADIGARRDLALISLEWLADDAGPRLHLNGWVNGEPRSAHLADCHHHGRWIRWHSTAFGARAREV